MGRAMSLFDANHRFISLDLIFTCIFPVFSAFAFPMHDFFWYVKYMFLRVWASPMAMR